MINQANNLKINVVALATLQVANFIFPLITLPYLTRVLGLEVFGLNIFVQSILQFFVLLTGWGFSLSATQKISINRGNNDAVDLIFSVTWAAQWLLMIISVCIMFIAYLSISAVKNNILLYACGYLAVFGSILFPNWLFQGMERMLIASAIQIASKIIILPMFFILIKKPQDASLAMALNGSASIIAGLITIWWLYKNKIVNWRTPKYNQICATLKESRQIFISLWWTSLYVYLTPVVLGLIAGPAALGIFNLADKFRLAGVAALAPLSQALFPRMSYLFEHDRNQARNLLKKSSAILVFFAIIGGFILYIEAENIISLFGGKEFISSCYILRILSPVPFIIILSNILGVQIMLPLNMNNVFGVIYTLAGMISLLIIFPLVYFFAEKGAAVNIIIVESLVTFSMAIYLWMNRYKINI